MISERIMYTVVCDNCGLDIGSVKEYSCWGDDSYARDNAIDEDWIEHDGKYYCPDCYTISDNDEIIINEARKVEIDKPFNPDPDLQHIQNVRDTCESLGCTPAELLKMNYMSELKK